MDGLMDRWIDEYGFVGNGWWMNEGMDGLMDGWVLDGDGWWMHKGMDGWTSRPNPSIYRSKC